MHKMTTCLWFDRNAEEAAKFYTSIFKGSKITGTSHYGKEGFEIHGMPEGTVLTVTFEINGQEFMALNGGPIFKFSESVSFAVNCKTQEEIDGLWAKLSANKEAEQCGWLKDKFGVSWQIVPTFLAEVFNGKTTEKTERVMKALLQMKKIDIAALKRAYES